ncbi:MAG: DUF2752 domain-containing protein [Clostridia bacterium]|nr:DUF2752 domain-containing protein [Clostridia bacterium]
MDKVRKNILLIYLGILVLGAAYIILSPLIFGDIGQPCPIYSLTGCLCPGCGATRMCFSLLRGDVAAAVGYNPFLFSAFLFWGGVSVFAFIGRPGLFRKRAFLLTAFFITAAIGVLFGILRNFS